MLSLLLDFDVAYRNQNIVDELKELLLLKLLRILDNDCVSRMVGGDWIYFIWHDCPVNSNHLSSSRWVISILFVKYFSPNHLWLMIRWIIHNLYYVILATDSIWIRLRVKGLSQSRLLLMQLRNLAWQFPRFSRATLVSEHPMLMLIGLKVNWLETLVGLHSTKWRRRSAAILSLGEVISSQPLRRSDWLRRNDCLFLLLVAHIFESWRLIMILASFSLVYYLDIACFVNGSFLWRIFLFWSSHYDVWWSIAGVGIFVNVSQMIMKFPTTIIVSLFNRLKH